MTADALLAAVLREEAPAWPFDDERAAGLVIEEAVRHGVHALVADRLRAAPPPGWPFAVTRDLAARATSEAALDVLREAEVRTVLGALGDAGVQVLLVKGGALAYTHYERPHLRPRFDTDLFLAPNDLAAAASVLERSGYTRPRQTSGRLVMHQVDYCRTDARGIRHVFDLHWKLANPHALADALSFAELAAEAVSIPSLGPHARAPAPVHALLVASIHRVAHHRDDERLIWLYDIHLLASSLDGAELERVASEARRRRIATVSAAGLERAAALFATPLPARVLADLTSATSGGSDEASAVFARNRVTRLDVLVSDLQSLDRWRDRLALVREHVLPPASYIRRAYGVSSRVALPALYAHRLVWGAWKWLRRTV